MHDRSRRNLLLVLGAVLSVWVVLGFFESAYFAAFFYGVPVPVWAAWVGQLPIWTFNAIDTVMVAVLVVSVVIALSARRGKRSMKRSSRGSAAGWVVAVVALVVLGAALFVALGVTVPGLWTDFKGFLGV